MAAGGDACKQLLKIGVCDTQEGGGKENGKDREGMKIKDDEAEAQLQPGWRKVRKSNKE